MKKGTLIQELILQGRSYSEIERETHACRSTIHYHAKKLGNPNQGKKKTCDLDRVDELILADKSNDTIRRLAGVSDSTICKRRILLGKPARRGSAEKKKVIDWADVQQFYDAGHNAEECQKRLKVSRRDWQRATKEQKIVLRTSHRRSAIWRCDLVEFRRIVSESRTYTEILARFGIKHIGSNCVTLKERLAKENIEFESRPIGHAPTCYSQTRTAASDYLGTGRRISTSRLKAKLIADRILPNVCSNCNLLPTWDGKPLVLILDHINGVNDDNRLTNLRLLCPNCNSQTETFAGRNVKRKK